MSDDAGNMLVTAGMVNASAVEAARAAVRREGGTLGEHLVASGDITDEALTDFYRHKLLVPRVSPNALAKLRPNVIATVSADLAIELRVVPVTFDPDGNLMIAMSDPTDSHAVDQLSFFTGKEVVRAVATQMQLAWCLAHYYGHVSPLGRRLMQPREAPIVPSAVPSPVPAGPVAAAGPLPATGPDEVPVLFPARTARSRAPSERADEITIEANEPPAPTPRRSARPERKVIPDPPELAARAGEVEVRGSRDKPSGDASFEPRVVIDLGDEPRPASEPDSEPILLDTPRPEPRESDVVLLEQRRDILPQPRRSERLTQVGVGDFRALPRAHRDTDLGTPSGLAYLDETTDESEALAEALNDESVPNEIFGDDTAVMEVPHGFDHEPTRRITTPLRTAIEVAGSGPIAQPSDIGAAAAAAAAAQPLESEPVASPDAEPEVVPVAVPEIAPVVEPVPVPEIAPVVEPVPAAPVAIAVLSSVELARELTSATSRLVELLRSIDSGATRDAVMNTMAASLSQTHHRAGFLAVRGNELSPFVMVAHGTEGNPGPSIPVERSLSLSLPTATTFADVVATQLPYRGPVNDPASQQFLTAMLGVSPDEIVLFPLVMRERVVGLLYGDGRLRHTFDDHFAIASRAAGQALERIVKAKKS